ncbi:hypothetical protein [Phyllobacterium sp. K27]
MDHSNDNDDAARKKLLDQQFDEHGFKDAMQTRYSLVANDDVVNDLLKRLDEAERKRP